MKTNLDFLEYSKNKPEDIFDPFYKTNEVVIPTTKAEHNTLVDNNEKLIKLITAFDVLEERYKSCSNNITDKIVSDIINILDNTKDINYSPFAQFFMVYNFNFSLYKDQTSKDKKITVYEMLKRYCKERHNMYLSHGYSNSTLQVMCDNYAHKRKSKAGIKKVEKILSAHITKHLKNKFNLISEDDYYFLPDKGDKDIFEHMLKTLNIKMESRKIEQGKLPDIVFKHNGHYYICELKTMKEGGGGQNKQVVEFAYFIRFSEDNKNIHYITFLDSNYANILFTDNSPKVSSQREDVLKALKNNPQNYFLNTKGLIEFIKEIFE